MTVPLFFPIFAIFGTFLRKKYSKSIFEKKVSKRGKIENFDLLRKQNKPKMAYSRDLPKMARQQVGIMD